VGSVKGYKVGSTGIKVGYAVDDQGEEVGVDEGAIVGPTVDTLGEADVGSVDGFKVGLFVS
jgi:hypothetical protein